MNKSTSQIGFIPQKDNSLELTKPAESPNDTREQNSSPNEQKQSCISMKCIFIIIGISLLVIIGIIILVVLVKKDDSPGDETNQINSETKKPENPQESPESSDNQDHPESPENHENHENHEKPENPDNPENPEADEL